MVSLGIDPDASLLVREDITIAFRGAHQEIFRAIPLRPHGLAAASGLRLEGIGAYDEAGRPLRAEIDRRRESLRIQVWVPGAVDATRTVTFVYRVRRGLLRLDDHDELAWNATGTEWAAVVREAQVVVTPPAGARDGLRAAAYTGPRGVGGQDYVLERVDRHVVFRTSRALRPGEGITVVVGWPSGLVGRPSALQEAGWLLADHWPLGLPGIAAVLGLAAWWAYGRDPGARSIRPEYEPPPGLTPAEAGTLVDEQAEPRDVVATIVDLAVRGYLSIERLDAGRETDFVFRRLRPVLGDAGLRPLELLVLARLFGEGWVANARLLSEVRRDYDNVFPPLRDQIYKAMVADRLFSASPRLVRHGWLLAGFLLVAGAVAVLGRAPAWAGVHEWSLPLGLALSGVVLMGWAGVMPRKTWRGVRMLARVRGFQEFLERAEKDRLERLPADTLHRWLAWAIALGVTERWIFGFEGLKVDDADWLRTEGPLTLEHFAREVSGFGHTVQEAILTTRRGAAAGPSRSSGRS